MNPSLIRQQPYEPSDFMRNQLDSFYAEQRRAREIRDDDEPVEEWPAQRLVVWDGARGER